MAGTEPEPMRAHPAGSAARPRLVLIQGGRDDWVPAAQRPPLGALRRFLGRLAEAMIAANGDFPFPDSWFE